jgi:hypothetical protein
MSIYINFHEFMFSYEAESDEKLKKNLFIQQFLMHPN